MLLKSLIDQLQANSGTPGTPDKNHGVPDPTPRKPAPRNDLTWTEHREHQEHRKNKVGEVENNSPAREAIAAQIRDLYADMASTMAQGLDCGLGPSWSLRMRELEEAFTVAWDEGGEPWDELGALKMHIRSGQHPYRCLDCFLSAGCNRDERRRWGLMCRHDCNAFTQKGQQARGQ